MLTRRQLFIAEWLFVFFALLTLGSYLAYSEYEDHQRIERDERARLAQQATVVEHNLVPQLEAANQALQNVMAELPHFAREQDGSQRLNRHLAALQGIVPGVRTLLVVDARGSVTASNVASNLGLDVSGRDWFSLAAKNNTPQMLYLTPPFQSAVSPHSVALVRSITGPKGEFAGAVFAALHPDFAKILLSSVVYTPDALASLVHANGIVFASTDDALVGKNIGVPESLFSRHRDAQQTATMFGLLAMASVGALALYQRVRVRNAAAKLRADSALAQSEQRFSTAFAAAPIAASIATLKDGRFIEANHNYERIFGWTREDVVGKSSVELGVWPDNATRAPWAQAMREHGELVNYETIWVHKNGQHRHVSLSAALTNVNGEPCILAYATDITERKLAEEKIDSLAFYDQLTGLPNRQLMLDRLRQAMTLGERSGFYAALLFIDLDHFKVLNETLGHDAGDELLQQVAQRLSQCVREGDTVARVGGDEFVVILANLGTSEEKSAAATEKVAEKILAELALVHQLSGTTHHSAASVGMTLFQGQGGSADDLLKQAELAMYRAKETGRNTMRFFDPEMQTTVLKHVALEKDLRAALQTKEFVLYYQPLVVGDGQLTGAEALVRWQHPQRGMVLPAEFIHLAEQTGLIVPLGLWVLEAACIQLAQWARRPERAHLTIAVNVSAHQFRQSDFVEQVAAVLQRTGANPRRLKLELTESFLINDIEPRNGSSRPAIAR
jgi:diguanylate cyclase (GGDEF)-like protein/PAS domain S-box-containing protein